MPWKKITFPLVMKQEKLTAKVKLNPTEDDNASAAEASVGTNAGWADAMARVLNKKIPESKPSILVRNKELEKEKEKVETRETREKKTGVSYQLLCTLCQG